MAGGRSGSPSRASSADCWDPGVENSMDGNSITSTITVWQYQMYINTLIWSLQLQIGNAASFQKYWLGLTQLYPLLLCRCSLSIVLGEQEELWPPFETLGLLGSLPFGCSVSLVSNVSSIMSAWIILSLHQKTMLHIIFQTPQFSVLLRACLAQVFIWQNSKEATKYLYFPSRCDLLGTVKCFNELYSLFCWT